MQSLLSVMIFSLILLLSCRQRVENDGAGSLAAAELQRRAEEALAGREGVVLVARPASGQLLAVVNPRLAFEQSFPPGSSIKPFSALAALAAGRVTLDRRHRCSGGVRDDAGNLLCSHRRVDRSLGLDEALAYSCNDYFLDLGTRLSRQSFLDYLRHFGLGAPTGVNATERPGRLDPSTEDRRGVIGEGPGLLVTPVQLLRAYLALVNGGFLCRPYLGDTAQDECRGPALSLPDHHRRVVIAGMRGAVTYGTASAAGLTSPEQYVFGKTGTAAASNGFRRHGWFVGFTADRRVNRVPVPAEVDLGLLVFLRQGTGMDAAEVAARLLGSGSAQPLPMDAVFVKPQTSRRVRLALSGTIRELPLEDYVTGVILAENGREKEREALRSQAVVARTFATGNWGRHASEGYDFCSTTHCQRFAMVPGAAISQAARWVAATAGQVLRDPDGGIAATYYHAACGGHTSSIGAVWGVKGGPPWLRGVEDQYCLRRVDRHWEDRLTSSQIERALQGNAATRDIGRLRRLVVDDVDHAGRALNLTIVADRRVRIRAWDFKLLVGRALGWQVLKSTIFDLTQDRNGYTFRGRGFGHGLGLCQDGAHELARRGRGYRQILRHYFPGAVLGDEMADQRGVDPPRQFSAIYLPQSRGERVLRDGGVRWIIPSRLELEWWEPLRRAYERARRDLNDRLGREIDLQVQIHIHETTAGFIAASGLSGYAAGGFQPENRGKRGKRGIRGNPDQIGRGGQSGQLGQIHLQPPLLLEKRGLLESTLRHELVHATLNQLNPQCPRWLQEGLAIHFAGEGAVLGRVPHLPRIRLAELEKQLNSTQSYRASKVLYAQAWRQVGELLRSHQESAVWQIAIGHGGSI